MLVFTSSRFLKYNKLTLLRFTKQYKNGSAVSRKHNTASSKDGTEHVLLSDGKKMTLSTGRYARIADGSVVASLGDTSVMATAVSKQDSASNSGVPLVVNYRQKAAAAGRIPTNYLRRELGPTEHDVLTSRIIDRSLRPLFPTAYSYETQVICNQLAIDGLNNPDVISINAASAALSVSDIPWNGPVGAVRVGMIDNEFIINPTRRELQQSTLNLVVSSASQNLVVMLEGSANDVLEQDLKKAIKVGVKECQQIVSAIDGLQKKYGKPKREIVRNTKPVDNVIESVKEFSEKELCEIFTNYAHDKLSRDKAIQDLRSRMIETIVKGNPDVSGAAVDIAFGQVTKDVFRELVFKNNVRCDGRKFDALRDISCQVNVFNPLHGSALFQRGQTQVLCTVTLDSLESALKMDTVTMLTSGIKEKNFFLHYEFPPYATNETGKLTGLNRREMGHGALAEKGLRPIIPKDYPFTIRLTSEVLESNGSSSMASVCGGSLALMDAGIPVHSTAAGVAIGLITKYQNSDTKHIEDYKILTDILGIEDYLGDMDFKVAGTRKGFTALQLDIKIPGLPLKIVMESIHRATAAKNQIINIMNTVLPTARTNKKNNMPVFETIDVPVHQRRKFLGINGMNLKKILVETGVQVYAQDDTTYCIFAPNETAMNEAKEFMEEIMKKEREPTLEFGSIYTAKIVEIRETGILVTLYTNMNPAFLPNSQLDQRVIHHPNVLGLEVGQEIQVKYFGRDPVSGQMRLSRKVLQESVSYTKTMST